MQKRSTDLRDVSISSVTDDSKTILDASISTIRNEIEVTTDASISGAFNGSLLDHVHVCAYNT